MFKFAAMLAAFMLGTALFSSGALLAGDSGHWSAGAPMPSERTEVSAAEINGKIYVAGGGAARGRSRADALRANGGLCRRDQWQDLCGGRSRRRARARNL